MRQRYDPDGNISRALYVVGFNIPYVCVAFRDGIWMVGDQHRSSFVSSEFNIQVQ